MPPIRNAVVILSMAGLAACDPALMGGGAMVPDEVISQCSDEAGISGQFTISRGFAGSVPFAEFETGANVTAQQAAIANACVQRLIPTAVSASEAEALRDGRAQSASSTGQASGSLPLPSEFPLMAGDAALWPTLTPGQQQRALAFLQSGSTIRSSLLPD